MNSTASNNKRIAINTLALYARMFIMMVIGLYTSRITLEALGISNLGVINVAGSVIGLFAFIESSLYGGTQRFFSFAIGEGNFEKLRSVFKCSLTLYLMISILIIILGETIGLWYVYNKLNVSPDAFNGALWCYQLSICSTVLGLLQVPFSASLIAHEKMGAFAYLSIFDALFKLLTAYLIMLSPFDKIIFYSSLLFFNGVFNIIIHNIYCQKHFSECKFQFGWNKDLIKEMFSFSGWNIIGSLAVIGQGSGLNLMINYFYNAAVNGARSIAMQANSWITRFIQDFQLALNPQIIKYYASGDYNNMSLLMIRGARYSSFLYLFLGIPLFININWILQFWLGSSPEYTTMFLRIIMIETLFRTMGNPTVIAMHATGKLKWVQLTLGFVQLSSVGISWLLFYLQIPILYVILVSIYPWILAIPMRLYWLKRYTSIKARPFILNVYLQIPVFTVILSILPALLYLHLNDNSFITFINTSLLSICWSFLIIYFIGLEKSARLKINSFIQNKFLRLKSFIHSN